MSDFVLKEPVELALPAQKNMMLVLRLTTAGVIARAGLTVDRMDDVKMAVEEACSCLINEAGGPKRLRLRFYQAEDGLRIHISGDGGCDAPVPEDECAVVRCILESLVDGVELCLRGNAIGAVELRVNLDA